MPIRPELRHLYRTSEWAAARKRILERAGGKCEQCGRPAGLIVFCYTWQSWQTGPGMQRTKFYHMVWILSDGGRHWFDQFGCPVPDKTWPGAGLPRPLRVQLGVAHVDPVGDFLSDQNLRAWCTWCHLHHDQPQHKLTRSRRKDAGRPLLQDAR